MRGIPYAVLVNASGKVAWRGHPGGLTDATIEEALEGALPTPLWEWPKSADGVKKALQKNSLAKALAAAEKVGPEYVTVVRGAIDAHVAGMKAAYEDGDFLEAQTMAEAGEKSLKGLSEAEVCAETLQAIDGDKEAKRILAGQEKLKKLVDKAREETGKKKVRAAVKDIEKLMEDYPGTIVARVGNQAVKELMAKSRR